MNHNIFVKGALALSLAGLVFATAKCDQPKAKCAAARQPFIGVYTNPQGGADCTEKGEQFLISTYNPTGKDNKANLDIASIAIESADLANALENNIAADLTDPDATHTPYSLGFFSTSEPDDSGLCFVPSLTTTLQNLPEIPADPTDDTSTATPATSQQYVWSNVKFYVAPQYQGNQFEADVQKTVDGKTCSYHVQGLAPYYPCSKTDPSDPAGEKQIAEPAFCAHEAVDGLIDPIYGTPFNGSQVQPDFAIKCDPDLLVCVPSKPFPSFN